MIEVQSLSRFYGTHQAVKDVSFSIAANEVIGFLGLNGAGKSTTLKVIAGLLPPSLGTVVVDGVDVTKAPVSFRSRIGYLPEEPPLYKEMTVTEFLTFLGKLRGMSNQALRERLPVVIQKCQLDGQEDRVIGELSHGYKKRVGIAQAIIHNPRLVILDEPISGLDPRQIAEMRSVVRGLSADATVLISSHILSEISQTCDRILMLHQGRLVAQGTEEELAQQTEDEPDEVVDESVEMSVVVRAAAPQLRAALDNVDLVSQYTVRPGREAGALSVAVTLREDRVEELVIALVKANIGVRQLVPAQSNLEKTFLNLTEDEKS